MLETLCATRYITPLREGGSLPAIVEADDGEMYVMKFVGAGQGPKALIAELICGEIGRALGLLVPPLALIELDPRIGRNERDPEIQDLLKASAGINLGMRFLPEALPFNPLQTPPTADLASQIVWFDAYITNVDRTPRNVNLLFCQEQLWLIDHGAALYFHHSSSDYVKRSRDRFAMIKHHVLLPFASHMDAADLLLRQRLSPELLAHILQQVPAHWLDSDSNDATVSAHRQAYVDYFIARLGASAEFVEEANHARSQLA